MYNVYDNGEHLLGRCIDIKKTIKNYILDTIEDMQMYKDLLNELDNYYNDTDILLIKYDDYFGCYIDCIFKNKDVIK